MKDEQTLNDAKEAYDSVDSDYKTQLTQYSVLLLSAELAVIGFLLQNEYTRILLKMPYLKVSYLISISFTVLAIAGGFLYKKFERKAAKSNMHAEYFVLAATRQFKILDRILEPSDHEEEKKKAILDTIRYQNFSTKTLLSAEVFITLAAVFGVIFVISLILSF